MKKVTVFGGGTGSYVVLSGLKSRRLDLAAIVTMMDSGGSTGRLRDQLGVLPPGDLRQCLVALSDASTLWRELFLYRFESGDLAGHNFGNIFLSALEKVSSNYNEVIETASYVLQTKGKVIPVTFEKTHLGVTYDNGKRIIGETHIDENNPEPGVITNAFLEPKAIPNPQSLTRIAESDRFIVGPGDLYTSIIPNFLPQGIKEAMHRSPARLIYILNLMTKHGQTTDYKASHHLKDITHYVGRQPDIVIVNNAAVPTDILAWYKSHHERLVENDLISTGYQGTIVEADLVDRTKFKRSKGDKLTRSILRHDTDKLAKVLLQYI
ncbi:YvcK family protein [Candidatus Roizmanbacteria bacterium]|nr:YvcK family protein [Candidatus Roizmanbacteria bacterium]